MSVLIYSVSLYRLYKDIFNLFDIEVASKHAILMKMLTHFSSLDSHLVNCIYFMVAMIKRARYIHSFLQGSLHHFDQSSTAVTKL